MHLNYNKPQEAQCARSNYILDFKYWCECICDANMFLIDGSRSRKKNNMSTEFSNKYFFCTIYFFSGWNNPIKLYSFCELMSFGKNLNSYDATFRTIDILHSISKNIMTYIDPITKLRLFLYFRSCLHIINAHNFISKVTV